jgi:hypothetical protein
MGNSYPSSVDWDAVAGWTKTNVDNATYIHVNSATWASYVAGVGLNGGTRYIAPGQGFFVSVADDGSTIGTLSMNNSVRVHNATTFFKEQVSNLVRLQVSGNGYTDESVVRFLPEATNGFDSDYDAYKLFGEVSDAAQIYSIGNTSLAINALPETTDVPVGIRVGTEGIYTIDATEINDLNNVVLEDTKTGTLTDLKNSNYSFGFVPGENEERFLLHFNALSVGETQKSPTNIFSSQKTVYVDLKNNVKGTVFIYNISGQTVLTAPVAPGLNKFALDHSGNYIIKVVTNQSTQVNKVWIN